MRTITTALAATLLFTAAATAPAASPSDRIDALVEAALAEHGLAPNPDADDTVFLRRVYLDIAGRIPSVEEATAFQTDESPDRRRKLIDRLLQSEAYVSNFYHFWADILRINNQIDGAAKDAYQLWIKQALRENKPYDELVYDLVTARGKTWENGAIGYYLRDRGMPLDNMSNTVRVFLGTRLECAQCHNHPFDKWTQMDYYQMASYSFGMDTKSSDDLANRRAVGEMQSQRQREAFTKASGMENSRRLNLKKMDDMFGTEKGAKAIAKSGLDESEFRRRAEAGLAAVAAIDKETRGLKKVVGDLYDPIQYISVSEHGEKLASLPHDYQYPDAEPKSAVPPAPMFGKEIALAEGAGKIEAYAGWMTSPENPTFTKVIANRLWKEVYGRGVFEPVDEIMDSMEIPNSELMAFLEKLMIDLEYDMKAFLRVLYNTRTYQRESGTKDVFAGEPYYFPGPLLRRMSAEQIWDSIVSLALPEADHYRPRLPGQLAGVERQRLIYESLEGRSVEEFMALLEKFAPRIAEIQAEQERIREEYAAARENNDTEKTRELKQELGTVSKAVYKELYAEAYHLLGTDIGNDKLKRKERKKTRSGDAAFLGMTAVSTGQMSENDAATGDSFTKLPKIELPEAPADLDRREAREWARQQKTDHGIYTKLISGMARASELESPAPRGHFLREFGQSDREVIENAADNASVPQALNLMNSTIVEALVNRFSVFGSRVHTAGTPEEKTRMIYQAMLTREPTAGELDIVRSEIEAHGDTAYEDIVWALLNTQQFLFVP